MALNNGHLTLPIRSSNRLRGTVHWTIVQPSFAVAGYKSC